MFVLAYDITQAAGNISSRLATAEALYPIAIAGPVAARQDQYILVSRDLVPRGFRLLDCHEILQIVLCPAACGGDKVMASCILSGGMVVTLPTIVTINDCTDL